jgi:hypothetical protein
MDVRSRAVSAMCIVLARRDERHADFLALIDRLDSRDGFAMRGSCAASLSARPAQVQMLFGSERLSEGELSPVRGR